MAIRINCEDLNSKKKVDLAEARRTAMAVLKASGVRSGELNIRFVDDPAIRTLNRRYLGRGYATDVIAFEGGKGHLGDVAISSDTAARNAVRYGVPVESEIRLLVIHGTLHVLGYDDVTARGRKIMRKKENEFIQSTTRPKGR
ncbi:MAG: rRNA maturation RNase YbeY [Candidatus Omnitrophica bacterium]|nr:rRNA maturation RNase YbeY [Candidatus Omnitrophota bacterium]MDD4013132.1 rRNA maturation RNase YbeY [Candidatus Omnitrophota bacterium]